MIERSSGLSTGLGFVVGGGYRGATTELDDVVRRAATMLADAYDMPVTIRFNSDRRSGGAWLKTHEPDGFGRNAEIGIGAKLITAEGIERARERYGIDLGEPGVFVTAHIGKDALRTSEIANDSGYYHGRHESLEDALAFVQTHGALDHLVFA